MPALASSFIVLQLGPGSLAYPEDSSGTCLMRSALFHGLHTGCCSVFSIHQCSFILLLGSVAGGGDVALSLQLLREPLLEMVRQQDAFVNELRVTNTYLRNSACWQFK